MNNKTIICLAFCLALITACSKDNTVSRQLAQPDVSNAGATQLSGVGFYATTDECTAGTPDVAYVVKLTGDFEGCLYTIVDDYACSPGGTYREEGREHFIGTYKGQAGEFWTTYKFESKYEGCAENGGPLGAELKGRCQHPIVKDSGEGVFEGAAGWMAFKDDVVAGNFPYRGHIKF